MKPNFNKEAKVEKICTSENEKNTLPITKKNI